MKQRYLVALSCIVATAFLFGCGAKEATTKKKKKRGSTTHHHYYRTLPYSEIITLKTTSQNASVTHQEAI